MNLTNLVDNQTTLTAKLKELQLKENHEGALFKEKRELQAKIAAYNAQSETRTKIETLNAQVAILTTEESNLLAKYNAEKDSPFNYYSVLSFKAGGDNQRVQVILRSYYGLELVAQPIGDWQKVKFTSTGDGYYLMSFKSMGEPAVVQVVLRSYYGLELAVYSVNNDNQKVKFTPTGDGYYVMSFQGRGDNQRVQVIGRSYMGLELVGEAINDYQKVKLISTGEQTNNNIAIAYDNWQAKLKQLNQAKEELNQLNLALTATATDKAAWDAFLAQVIQEITTIKTQLNTLNTDFLNGVKSTQQTLLTMPEIASQGDLVTTGAILDFIDSASRVTVLETCEGMVQLSYFDQQGKLRQGVFDATADEVNSYFEQWLPDYPPVCLNCNHGNQRIDLSGNGIFLSDNWTIEANFVYPLADTNQWNSLAAQSSGERQIVVKNEKYLGTDVNNTFYYCLVNSTLTNEATNAYDLSQLSPGWHHLAVVGTTVTDGQTVIAKTIFYIDAKKVGECNVKSSSSINHIGNIQAGGEAFGKISEIRLWNIALKDTEILANSQVYLTGNEPGLVSYHRLDEGSGNEARDYTGNGNNGTIIGENWWGSTKVLAAPIAQVMNFDGNGDYVAIPSSLLNDRSAFTMEGWIKPASFVGNTSLFGQNDLVKFGLISQELAIWTNNSGLLKTTYSYSANEWHHVAVVGDGQKISVYIDGVKKTEGGSTTSNYGTSSFPVTIGAGVWNTGEKDPFTGQMADIRIWSIARTQVEIQANMTQRLKGKETGLELYLPLNRTYLEGTTTKVWDLAKNHHGTVYGASLTTATPKVVKQAVSALVPVPAVVFDGVNDYINFGNPTTLAFPGTVSYTIEAWINPDNTGKEMSIISKWNSGINGSFNFYVDSQKKLAINHNVPPWVIISSGTLETGKFNHVAVTYSGSVISFYINGQPAGTGNIGVGGSADKTTNVLIGAYYHQYNPTAGFFKGKIAEVRIWNKTRTQAEIQSTMNQSLSGTEANLVGYWRLNNITGTTVTGVVGGINGTVSGGASLATTNDLSFPVISNVLSLDSLPLNQGNSTISSDALISSVEYGTYDIDPISKQKAAMMRRMFAYPSNNGVEVLTDKRIENLELIWIGNAQFKPTLLGYMEGAPPVPSENMNIDGDYQYNGATSVELTTSEDVEYSWNRSQNAGLGGSADIFLGVESESFAGVGVSTQIESAKAGIKGTLDMSYQWLNESNVSSSSSLLTTDRLDLRGAPEVTAKFPQFGRRFMPKNVGYALVVSGLADVFITRLSRSQKMVGYEVRPVEDIPPDVNTITFLMNPAYVMNGSLDGLVGSSAANDEFYAHVPEMRSQYGSLYPASYFRLM
ncbi:MAG: LamG domain-containing protein, partial [Nodularia sp. (in: cyanobacteria)]|nr:LamG domain-containing protein [Nodularia sp. (in: cyanobacteria)]